MSPSQVQLCVAAFLAATEGQGGAGHLEIFPEKMWKKSDPSKNDGWKTWKIIDFVPHLEIHIDSIDDHDHDPTIFCYGSKHNGTPGEHPKNDVQISLGMFT